MSTFASRQNTTDKSPLLSNPPNAVLLLQRKCACGTPTSSLTGSCPECQSKKLIQTKLTVGASNDPLEQEADRVADQVLAAPKHSTVSGAAPHIQRLTGQASGDAATAPASVDRVLSGSGRPLDQSLQQDMGLRFGHDFSQVRVHTGSAAEQSAQDMSARAYTVGHNIVFGAGGFAPGSHEGRKLIAHELTHVVQQSSNIATIQRLSDPDCGTTVAMPMKGSCSEYLNTCNSETFVPASSSILHISVDVNYAAPPGNIGPEDFSVQVYKCGTIWDTKIGSKRLGPNIPSNLSFDIASVTPGDKYYLKIYSRSNLTLNANYRVTQ